MTARGRLTRSRIVHAACDLMYARGINATTLDDVRDASGTSKSQLYQYFSNKDELVIGVVEEYSARIIDREERFLNGVSTISGLERWATALVKSKEALHGAYGCVIGSFAMELADQNEKARERLQDTFEHWQNLIAAALERISPRSDAADDIDYHRVAIAVLAAAQGGYILAQAAHNVTPMRISMDMALAHVRANLR
jgi:AcrR family transcriptional regulator